MTYLTKRKPALKASLNYYKRYKETKDNEDLKLMLHFWYEIQYWSD